MVSYCGADLEMRRNFRIADYSGQWEKVDLTDDKERRGYKGEGLATYKSWTIDAIHCFQTNKGCETCPTGSKYGLHWSPSATQSQCRMPYSVQSMLNTGVKPGQSGNRDNHRVKYYRAIDLEPDERERLQNQAVTLFKAGKKVDEIGRIINLFIDDVSPLIMEVAKQEGYHSILEYRGVYKTPKEKRAIKAQRRDVVKQFGGR